MPKTGANVHPPGLASLDAPETTESLPAAETAAQRALHRGVIPEWQRVISALQASPEDRLQARAGRISRCGMAPMLLLSAKGKLTVSPGYCRDRMCPTCQARRARVLAANITHLCGKMDAPRFLTLTMKAVDRPLFLTIAALAASFREFRKSTEWKRHVRGGVYVIEVTRGADGRHWHAHLHLIVDGCFWHQRDISRAWLRITGDSPIVDIRAVPSRSAVACYIAKYVAKPTGQGEWGAAELCEFADAMHGRRMVHTFGASYAADVEDDHPGEKLVKAEPLCTMNNVHRLAWRGDAYALLARELLSQRGGLVAVLAARRPGTGAKIVVPPNDADDDRLLYCLRYLGSRHPDDPLRQHTHWDDAAAKARRWGSRQLDLWWVPTENPSKTGIYL